MRQNSQIRGKRGKIFVVDDDGDEGWEDDDDYGNE